MQLMRQTKPPRPLLPSAPTIDPHSPSPSPNRVYTSSSSKVRCSPMPAAMMRCTTCDAASTLLLRLWKACTARDRGRAEQGRAGSQLQAWAACRGSLAESRLCPALALPMISSASHPSTCRGSKGTAGLVSPQLKRKACAKRLAAAGAQTAAGVGAHVAKPAADADHGAGGGAVGGGHAGVVLRGVDHCNDDKGRRQAAQAAVNPWAGSRHGS